jgi:hypothetical protein
MMRLTLISGRALRETVVLLQVLEAVSGARFGDFAARLTSDHFLNAEPMPI